MAAPIRDPLQLQAGELLKQVSAYALFADELHQRCLQVREGCLSPELIEQVAHLRTGFLELLDEQIYANGPPPWLAVPVKQQPRTQKVISRPAQGVKYGQLASHGAPIAVRLQLYHQQLSELLSQTHALATPQQPVLPIVDSTLKHKQPQAAHCTPPKPQLASGVEHTRTASLHDSIDFGATALLQQSNQLPAVSAGGSKQADEGQVDPAALIAQIKPLDSLGQDRTLNRAPSYREKVASEQNNQLEAEINAIHEDSWAEDLAGHSSTERLEPVPEEVISPPDSEIDTPQQRKMQAGSSGAAGAGPSPEARLDAKRPPPLNCANPTSPRSNQSSASMVPVQIQVQHMQMHPGAAGELHGAAAQLALSDKSDQSRHMRKMGMLPYALKPPGVPDATFGVDARDQLGPLQRAMTRNARGRAIEPVAAGAAGLAGVTVVAESLVQGAPHLGRTTPPRLHAGSDGATDAAMPAQAMAAQGSSAGGGPMARTWGSAGGSSAGGGTHVEGTGGWSGANSIAAPSSAASRRVTDEPVASYPAPPGLPLGQQLPAEYPGMRMRPAIMQDLPAAEPGPLARHLARVRLERGGTGGVGLAPTIALPFEVARAAHLDASTADAAGPAVASAAPAQQQLPVTATPSLISTASGVSDGTATCAYSQDSLVSSQELEPNKKPRKKKPIVPQFLKEALAHGALPTSKDAGQDTEGTAGDAAVGQAGGAQAGAARPQGAALQPAGGSGHSQTAPGHGAVLSTIPESADEAARGVTSGGAASVPGSAAVSARSASPAPGDLGHLGPQHQPRDGTPELSYHDAVSNTLHATPDSQGMALRSNDHTPMLPAQVGYSVAYQAAAVLHRAPDGTELQTSFHFQRQQAGGDLANGPELSRTSVAERAKWFAQQQNQQVAPGVVVPEPRRVSRQAPIFASPRNGIPGAGPQVVMMQAGAMVMTSPPTTAYMQQHDPYTADHMQHHPAAQPSASSIASCSASATASPLSHYPPHAQHQAYTADALTAAAAYPPRQLSNPGSSLGPQDSAWSVGDGPGAYAPRPTTIPRSMSVQPSRMAPPQAMSRRSASPEPGLHITRGYTPVPMSVPGVAPGTIHAVRPTSSPQQQAWSVSNPSGPSSTASTRLNTPVHPPNQLPASRMGPGAVGMDNVSGRHGPGMRPAELMPHRSPVQQQPQMIIRTVQQVTHTWAPPGVRVDSIRQQNSMSPQQSPMSSTATPGRSAGFMQDGVPSRAVMHVEHVAPTQYPGHVMPQYVAHGPQPVPVTYLHHTALPAGGPGGAASDVEASFDGMLKHSQGVAVVSVAAAAQGRPQAAAPPQLNEASNVPSKQVPASSSTSPAPALLKAVGQQAAAAAQAKGKAGGGAPPPPPPPGPPPPPPPLVKAVKAVPRQDKKAGDGTDSVASSASIPSVGAYTNLVDSLKALGAAGAHRSHLRSLSKSKAKRGAKGEAKLKEAQGVTASGSSTNTSRSSASLLSQRDANVAQYRGSVQAMQFMERLRSAMQPQNGDDDEEDEEEDDWD